MAVRAVVFDIGETLLDDTREFGAWAGWIGSLGTRSPQCWAR